MIGYLKGTIAGTQHTSNRVILILDVNQVGYELQVPPRLLQQLPPVGEGFQVFTDLHVREDRTVLYGFASAPERDLFRQLISVSGVGAQVAIALLDTLGLPDLVQAIVTGNTRMLAKTPGVGSKTAERLALELKTKLKQWRQDIGGTVSASTAPPAEILEDVEMTLLALGYTTHEVAQALQTIGQDPQMAKSNSEEWIRSAISWLSQ